MAALAAAAESPDAAAAAAAAARAASLRHFPTTPIVTPLLPTLSGAMEDVSGLRNHDLRLSARKEDTVLARGNAASEDNEEEDGACAPQ